jgi:predicted  nucleic acid-binding Zn-ribbon protein
MATQNNQHLVDAQLHLASNISNLNLELKRTTELCKSNEKTTNTVDQKMNAFSASIGTVDQKMNAFSASIGILTDRLIALEQRLRQLEREQKNNYSFKEQRSY